MIGRRRFLSSVSCAALVACAPVPAPAAEPWEASALWLNQQMQESLLKLLSDTAEIPQYMLLGIPKTITAAELDEWAAATMPRDLAVVLYVG